MATKKQKHQAALERREHFMDVVRQDGLIALNADRERRAAIAERAEKDRLRERNKKPAAKSSS